MATQSVGNTLREARLRRGLTLDEISASTKIPVRILDAIEADDFHQVSSAFLYKSFARQVATLLQLDYAQLQNNVNTSAEAFPQLRMPGQEEHGPKVPALGVSREYRVRWGISVVALAVVLTGCSGLYAMWQKARNSANSTVVEEPQNTVPEKKQVSVAPSAEQERALAANQTAEQSGLELKISAVENSWVSIDTDGKRMYSGLLQAADTKVLEGHETARVHTGNAGGIDVVFNGKQLGALGGRGQVMTVVFTRNNYEVVEPHLSAAIRFSPVANITAR